MHTIKLQGKCVPYQQHQQKELAQINEQEISYRKRIARQLHKH